MTLFFSVFILSVLTFVKRYLILQSAKRFIPIRDSHFLASKRTFVATSVSNAEIQPFRQKCVEL